MNLRSQFVCLLIFINLDSLGTNKRKDESCAIILAESWNSRRFSKVTDHNNRYVYLVHAMTGDSPLLNHPELLATIPFLSASVISNSNNPTWESHGVIFDNFDDKNILAAAPYDLGFDGPGYNNDVKAAFADIRAKEPFLSPETLINETGLYYYDIDVDGGSEQCVYNEAIITPGTLMGGKQMKIQGYYLMTDSNGRFVSPPLIRSLIEKAANRLRVPVRYLARKRKYRKGLQLRPAGLRR